MEWKEYKKQIKSISNEEKAWIELLEDIVTARKDKGITQRKLADLTGLKQEAIARFENVDGGSPNILTVLKILNGLGYKLSVAPTDE
jgi:transcriptional regulator with XRE-family HTH domain